MAYEFPGGERHITIVVQVEGEETEIEVPWPAMPLSTRLRTVDPEPVEG